MSLIYEPEHFAPQELISPAIWKLCGADALYMYHPAVLMGIDKLRSLFGPMIMNTWHSKKLQAKYGYHIARGLRATNQKIGGELSTHKLGIQKKDSRQDYGMVAYSGADVWPVKVSAAEIREEIKEDPEWWSKYFTRIETHHRRKVKGKLQWVEIPWFHGDNKPHLMRTPIKFFKA